MKIILFLLFSLIFTTASDLGKFNDPSGAPQQKVKKKSSLDKFEEKIEDLGCDTLMAIADTLESKRENTDSKKKKKFYYKVESIVNRMMIDKECEEK